MPSACSMLEFILAGTWVEIGKKNKFSKVNSVLSLALVCVFPRQDETEPLAMSPTLAAFLLPNNPRLASSPHIQECPSHLPRMSQSLPGPCAPCPQIQ